MGLCVSTGKGKERDIDLWESFLTHSILQTSHHIDPQVYK